MNKKVVKMLGTKNTTYNGRVETLYHVEIDDFQLWVPDNILMHYRTSPYYDCRF